MGITPMPGTAGEHAEMKLVSTWLSNLGELTIEGLGVSRRICPSCALDLGAFNLTPPPLLP